MEGKKVSYLDIRGIGKCTIDVVSKSQGIEDTVLQTHWISFDLI